MNNKFDDIRPYNHSEVNEVLRRLTEQKSFMKVISTIFPLMPKQMLKEKLLSFDSIDDLQKGLILPYLEYLEANKTKGIEIKGLENLDPKKSYLFISNHRDIVLDSAFLCYKLIQNGRESVEIAIGDNLLIFPWIKDTVRLNKSFIVKRGLNSRDILASSQHLSEYIHYAINDKKESIWLAQREGRAKDSDDRTQSSLLKMLAMGDSSKSFIENLKNVNICPLTISYEYDPCDYLKAKEYQQKRDNPTHKKLQEDDLINMQTGIMGYKGKVVFHISPCINAELDKIAETTNNKNKQVKLVAELIDRNIHANYNIEAINEWAYDKLEGTHRFTSLMSTDAEEEVKAYFRRHVERIDLPNVDTEFVEQRILEMYANPLKNKLAVE